eukprot:UN14436
MGIKFTDEQLMDFMECTDFGNGKYNMIFGRDEQLLSALVIGAEGSVGSTFSYLDFNLQLMEAYNKNDMSTALAMQKKTTDVCNFFWKLSRSQHSKSYFADDRNQYWTTTTSSTRPNRSGKVRGEKNLTGHGCFAKEALKGDCRPI